MSGSARSAASACAVEHAALALARAHKSTWQRELAAWFEREARDLPWRRTRDAYAIWISESMLQQTRVETVAPYWQRFLERFPDAAALARASEDEVLALWSGLGYYRRARALHAAAKQIAERHGGAFPRDTAAIRALPGVGAYTAGAVASIAFDRGEPLVDGNVTRVFARLFELDLALGEPALARLAWKLAAELVPEQAGAGRWNQALMELGATVCAPREPRCAACPLEKSCAARASGRARELPRPKERREPLEVALEIYVARADAALLCERRPAAGRMAGLWQLPTYERAQAGQPERLFPFGPPAGALEPGAQLGEIRHTITHHRIRARVRSARWRGAHPPPEPFAWQALDALAGLPRTGMTRKVLALPGLALAGNAAL